jgi:hypothetical protein
MPVIAGTVRNAPKGLRSWISFLKKHGGKGYSREELVRMFHREHGSSRRRTRRVKRARRARRRRTRQGGAYETESESE